MSDIAPRSLSSLTREQKNEAFKKTRAKANIQGGTLVLISEPLYDAVVNVMIEHFVPYEPVSKSLKCSPDDWKRKIMKTLSYNMSTALIKDDDGDIMAVCLVVIGKADENITTDVYMDTGFKALRQFCHYCDNHANFYTHFGTEEAIHTTEWCVSYKYRNRTLMSKLFDATLNFFRNLGISPIYVKVECTSNFSKSIAEKQGFEILYEQVFSEYTVDGKVIINNTGEHKSMKVYGKRLDVMYLL